MEPQDPADEFPLSSDRRRRRTARFVIMGFASLVVVAALVAGAFTVTIARSFDAGTQKIADPFPAESSRPVKPTTGPASQAENILVIGSDSRGAALNLAEEGKPSNQRSDTLMWIHIPADHKNVYMMSIMRDTWVDIPGFGDAKINAAMAYGGVPLVVQTVEGIFKTRIDHVMIADFDGFEAITNELGGVKVDVPTAFTSTTATPPIKFKAGEQTLDGVQALAFVRERYSFATGDYQRVKDQQLFLKAVLAKTMTGSIMANPITVNNLVSAVAPYLSVDKGLTASTVASLAFSLRNVRSNDVVSFTLPNLGTGDTDGQSIVINSPTADAAVAKALSTDTLGPYIAQENLANH